MQRKYAIGFNWMANTPQERLHVSRDFGQALEALVKQYGRDRIAKLAGVVASTVHRNINEGRLTYTTALKLRAAIRQAADEDGDVTPSLPEPFYPVVSDTHYAWCQLGERLLALPSEVSIKILNDTIEAIHDAERDATMRRANRSLAHPLPGRAKLDDSGD